MSKSPLKEHQAKLKVLRAALEEGERSGAPTEFDFEEFVDSKRRKTQVI